MTITVLFICVVRLSMTITTILKIWGTLIMTIIITITRKFQYDFEYNYILRIWGTLIMTIIITINREFQYDFEYNYHTQNMGNVDDYYIYYNQP